MMLSSKNWPNYNKNSVNSRYWVNSVFILQILGRLFHCHWCIQTSSRPEHPLSHCSTPKTADTCLVSWKVFWFQGNWRVRPVTRLCGKEVGGWWLMW